ncbi:hypothetical protein WJ0W_004698 [Paenibacillus melissococcoides]|uniref:Uncharacterized protein n=1 Tax=Paenibacillus melissococcoides TaxID=2912268 RepID=A0ABM9FWR7_9BACL|nr:MULTISPECIES: hypothetical protein [Paenibacillus]CAH8243627.1 hypothetical protein WJ0W_000867 [Paenibacillus melissococcoides]CAH8247464.1 hypothetical protein WJ0W_004698 [Paenibacillus melissococcoides]CAH8705064.1 hypothetical protein HTL2_000782 [Paenibacillus melissococcoides]CAH8705066.1 hypothetical protein WDD9_000851 [Paenibacillus melissococcoides]CAH8707838.1 hypothetical protein WDD9_001745 [Paenibacillus melissococcoides]
MAKKMIAKTPIGYAGHLLSPGDNVREYIHDQSFISLLLEKGHAAEVDEESAAPAPAEAQEQPEEEAPSADKQPEEAPTAETPERKPEAPATGRKRGK